jgi:hypothetical protein
MVMETDPVDLIILPERPVVRKEERSEIDVVIEIRCKKTAIVSAVPKPLNLCVVIDRSGSMAGQKLEMAKRSCLAILRQLRESDLFTVVTFDTEARVVANPQVGRSEVPGRIEGIDSGGQTNLSLGWYLGLLELQTHTTRDYNNRLFLLSDGEANQGETKRATLANESARSRELGISTSTIGIGESFQEDLLEVLATESGGRFWYVQESRIEDIIEEEFQGALSVAIDRPRVELLLDSGVKVSKELNALNRVSGRYRLRPLKGDDVFNFAIRMETTPQEVGADRVTIKAVLYDGDRFVTRAEESLRLVREAEFVSSPSNPLVPSVVRQYETTVTNETLLEKMADGDLNLMKKMLMAEVGGMRVVRDALAGERQDEHERARFLQEVRHLVMDLNLKETSVAICEMAEDFVAAPEIRDFILRWRKIMMHGHHRMKERAHGVLSFDRDGLTDLLKGAIDLADTLAERYPAKAAKVTQYREQLRDQLARYQ